MEALRGGGGGGGGRVGEGGSRDREREKEMGGGSEQGGGTKNNSIGHDKSNGNNFWGWQRLKGSVWCELCVEGMLEWHWYTAHHMNKSQIRAGVSGVCHVTVA